MPVHAQGWARVHEYLGDGNSFLQSNQHQTFRLQVLLAAEMPRSQLTLTALAWDLK